MRTMYVAALIALGYRNLEGEYPLCRPLAVLVGENNTGKSNVVDGLRTVLEAEGGPRAACWLRRLASGAWIVTQTSSAAASM